MPQVGEPEPSWDDGAAQSAAAVEHRHRVEREREIACYLLMVGLPPHCASTCPGAKQHIVCAAPALRCPSAAQLHAVPHDDRGCGTCPQAVYDASPLVRAEVAVGLARLAQSHSVLFQVRHAYKTVTTCSKCSCIAAACSRGCSAA